MGDKPITNQRRRRAFQKKCGLKRRYEKKLSVTSRKILGIYRGYHENLSVVAQNFLGFFRILH